MLLTIDLGNTNICAGVFQDENLIADFKIKTKNKKSSDEYALEFINFLKLYDISPKDIDIIILSSVVPSLNSVLERAFAKYFQAKFIMVDDKTDTGINILTANPEEVGADRIVNVTAARHIYKQACIVVDFGTATTFDYVDKDANFKYTIITPGLASAAKTLFSETAKLPDVEIKKPNNILADNTVTGMQAGIVYGYIGLVSHILTEFMHSLNTKPLVIATGGVSKDFVNEIEEIDKFEENLALKGMQIIAQRLKHKGL